MRGFTLALAGGALVATTSLAADKKTPINLDAIAGVDPTGIVKPLSEIRLRTKKKDYYKCVTPWQNAEYVVSSVWAAYKVACKAHLEAVYTTLSAANPVVGGVLLSTCTVPELYEGAAKLVGKLSGPKGFAFVDGKAFAGTTRWFTDRGWYSAELMKDDDVYVTVGRERTPAQLAGKAKIGKAIVNVCGLAIEGTQPKTNGDWQVKASTCGCQEFTFDDKSPDQVIVPMKKMKGKILHVFVDGRTGAFKYGVALSKTPAESPAVTNPVAAATPVTTPAPVPTTPAP
jgi:hypothetical protein